MWRDNKRRDHPPEWCYEAALTAWEKMTRGRRDKIGACARHLKTRVPGSREFCKWLEQLVIECRKRRRVQKNPRRKNLYIRKGQPKFVVSIAGGGEVWSYAKLEIELRPSERGKWTWQLFTRGIPLGPALSAAGRDDALAAAKADVDRIKYSGDLSSRTTMADWNSFDIMNSIIEGLAFEMGYEGKRVTRASVSRELERRRGLQGYSYDFTFFDNLPLERRLQWIDDRIASAKRKLRLAAKPNPRKRPAPKKNPARAEAIMRSFMRL